MPKPRGPIPSPLDAVQKMLQTGSIGGGRAEAPGDQETGLSVSQTIRRSGDQASNLPGDQDTRILVPQEIGGLGDQDTRRSGYQDTRILRDQGIGSRNAKSSSSQYSKLGVYIPIDLYRWLKVQSATTGREISDIVAELVQERKDKQERG